MNKISKEKLDYKSFNKLTNNIAVRVLYNRYFWLGIYNL